jgi:hypothetical protein
MQAALIEPTFSAWHSTSVIAEIDDDRIFSETIFF